MARIARCLRLVLAAGVLFWEPALRGQARDVTQVLAAARDALGGEKNLAAVKTFVANGRTRQIRGNNLIPIEFEIACELPDKYVRRDEFPAQDAPPAIAGFRGDTALGSQPIDATRSDYVRLMLGAFAAPLPSLPLTFTYAAEGDAPEGKADVLDVSGPAHFAAQFVLQRDTHLPVMLMWKGPPAGGPPSAGGRAVGPPPGGGPVGPPPGGARAGGPPPAVEHRLYFADYRSVNGGVKWPFRIRHAVGGTTIEETTFDRVSINAKIDPRKFEAPK